MNVDTPAGRLLVATCNKSQLEAVSELIEAGFVEGFNKGAKAAFQLVQDLINNEDTNKTLEQMERELDNDIRKIGEQI